MRILATSDLHGYLPEIEPCDILILAGDIAPDFGWSVEANIPQQRDWFSVKFRPWLQRQPAKHIIGIAGNHDFALQHTNIGRELPWEYLCDDAIVREGIVFHGLPWVPHLRNWAFYGDKKQLYRSYGKISEHTDVVISHGPPYGIGDQCGPKWGVDTHVGATQALSMLKRVDPKLYICGHIHEAFGVYQHFSTNVLNVSIKNDNYEVVRDVVDVSSYL